MNWLLHVLSTHPEIQTRVRQEVTEKLPALGQTITVEHLNQLTYTTSVIKETLRS